jgi:hypothetical protein
MITVCSSIAFSIAAASAPFRVPILRTRRVSGTQLIIIR